MNGASPFIVRAATIAAKADATAIVAAAEQEAQRIRAAVEEERHSVFETSRRDGFRQGLAEAAVVTSQAVAAIETFWQARGDELREVALAVAHRILASLPADEIVARLASEALAEHANDSRLELRAAPETAAALRAALHGKPSGARVVVTPDASLPREACVLLHSRGRSEVGLLAQFRSLMATDAAAAGSHL